MAPGRTQVVADLGLYLLGGPRATAPSGQLQTTSKLHHPTTSTSDTFKGQTQLAPERCWSRSCSVGWAPAQLILHSSLILVVSGHSQSLPLTCQQQIKAELQEKGVHSPQEGCTPSTQLGWSERLWHWTLQNTHYIRPFYQAGETQQLYLIHRNKLSKWEGKETGPKWKNRTQLQKRTKQNGDKESIRCRVQNTGYKDVQWT